MCHAHAMLPEARGLEVGVLKRNWRAAPRVELISKDPDKANWKNSTLSWLALNFANLDKKRKKWKDTVKSRGSC